MTTSSSLPRTSEILLAINLRARQSAHQLRGAGYEQPGPPGPPRTSSLRDLLFQDLQIDLLHVNFLVEFVREFGALEQLRVHTGRHLGARSGFSERLLRLERLGLG